MESMEKELRQIQQRQHWSDGTLLFFILRNLRHDEALLETLKNIAQTEQDVYARAEVHNVGVEQKKKKKKKKKIRTVGVKQKKKKKIRTDKFNADSLPSPS